MEQNNDVRVVAGAGGLSWSADVNLADYLLYRHGREGHGTKSAIIYRQAHLTYEDLMRLCARTAALLRTRGIHPGDRVILLLPDSPAFVAAFFGTLAIEAIAVPLNPALSAEDVCYMASLTEAKAVIVDVQLRQKFQLVQNVQGVEVFITAGDGLEQTAELEQAIALGTAGEYSANARPSSLAYCLFSSGTTGSPKGIAHRHTDFLHCAAAYACPVLQMSQDDVTLSVPKLHSGYGVLCNLLFTFLYGATAILMPGPATAEALCEVARNQSPTLLFAQPRIISEILETDTHTSAFSSLRLAVSGGEVLAPVIYQRWKDRYRAELIDSYGSTEMGALFISNIPGAIRPQSAGRVLAGYRIKIMDETGQPVPLGSIGHLWVQGDSMTPFYWNDAERTKSRFCEGWFLTGDLFRQDEAGYLYFCGRADEMIKFGCGEWVFPPEIENVLREHEAVQDCAVVGFGDVHGAIRLKAYVVLHDGLRPNSDLAEALRSLVLKQWPDLPYKHLDCIEFATDLPRTSTGKLQRFKLQPEKLTNYSYKC